ncbi:MAG: hypothetical protein ACRD3V_26545 [Vicinamibacteria bacterium]
MSLVLSLALVISFALAQEAEEKQEDPPLPSNQKLNEYGVFPASALHDGGLNLPPELRVPEQYQYLRPDLQLKEAELTGKQLPPVLTEMKVLTKEPKPGTEVRAIARVTSPYNKAESFVSLFYNQELGRAATMYVNFKPQKDDPTLFLGRGKLSKWAAPGRYVVGTTIISDAVGDRKAYWADFHEPMQEKDGSPVGFDVGENPLADLEAPTLDSVTIETPRVRAGGDLVRFTVLSKDDKSGPTEAEAMWVSPSGKKQIRTTLVMVGGKPGTFRGVFTVPRWYEGGEWKIMSVALKDDATNVRYYFHRTEPLLANASVLVDQEPEMVDLTPGRILAVQFSNREALVGDSVTMTVLAEDDLSGISAIEGYVRSPNGADALQVKLKSMTEEGGEFVDLNRPSKIPEPNVWTGTFKVTDTMEWGEWKLVRLGIADEARNFYTYFLGRDEELEGLSVDFIHDEDDKEEATTEKEAKR